MPYPRPRRRQILACAAWLAATGGCRQSSPPNSGFKMGLCLADGNSEFDQVVRNAVETFAREKGVELVVRDAHRRVSEQTLAMQEAIQQGLSVLLVVPVDSAQLTDLIKKAEAQKSYVVLLGEGSEDQNAAALIRCNPVLTGRLCAEYLASRLPNGGDVIAVAAQARGPEWFRSLQEAAGQVGPSLRIRVVARGDTEVRRLVDAALAAHPGARAVVAADDALTLAAARAVQGKRDAPFVIGHGGGAAAVAELQRAGSPLAMLLGTFPQRVGLAGARQAWRIVSNAPATPRMDLPVLPVVRETAARFPGWKGRAPKDTDLTIPWKSNLKLETERD